MSYTVGEVARLAGVTVRTLHHYDEIGLLSPGERSPAGYRRYLSAELDRLYRILLYRELGLPLDAIAAVVDGGDGDPATQLREQHALLLGRIDRLRRMAASVEHVVEAMEMGRSLTPEEKSEIFGEFREPPGYAEQAGRRWGGTTEWRVAQDRVAAMDTADWHRVEAERADWVRKLLALVDAGAAVDSPAARELAEEHRTSLAAFMGECDHEMQCRIAELYVSEPEQLGFLVREQDQRPGLAEFIRDMVRANAADRS